MKPVTNKGNGVLQRCGAATCYSSVIAQGGELQKLTLRAVKFALAEYRAPKTRVGAACQAPQKRAPTLVELDAKIPLRKVSVQGTLRPGSL
jgi:hypothetical protein